MSNRGYLRGGREYTSNAPIRGRGRGRGAPPVGVFTPQRPHTATVNPRVKQKEDAIESAFQLNPSNNAHFPDRPGFGTRGREIILWTNYFELIGYSDLLLYRYGISVNAEQHGKTPQGKRLNRVVQLLLDEHLDQYRPDLVSDYKSTILSKQALDVPDHYEVEYRDDGQETIPPNPTTYHVKLQQTAMLSMSELLDYITSMRSATLFGSKEELVQALNIVIGHHPKTAHSIANVGANRHYGILPPSDRFDLGAGLQAISGFVTSVRLATSRVLVNLQVRHAAFYAEGPLVGVMHAFIRENGPSNARLQNFLRGLSINLTHLAQRSSTGQTILRIKQITALANRGDGVQQQNPPVVSDFGAGPKNVKFFLARGKQQATTPGKAMAKRPNKSDTVIGPDQYITVYDFFRQTYSITITDTSLPVVNVGTSNSPVYLPAQVCEVPSGQHALGNLSPSQTQNMIKFAVRTPQQNATSITATATRLLGFKSPNITLGAFGLEVDDKLLSVTGRILECPTVLYRGSGVAATRFGSWNLQKVQLAATASLPYWTSLAISFQGQPLPWGSSQELHDQIRQFAAKLNEVGIKTATCTEGMSLFVSTASAHTQIDAAIHRFMNSPNRAPPKFLLVILPARNTSLYNRVKYACDIKEGLLNVCVVASKFMKPYNDQYFANISLKVNLKLGGTNHTLNSSKLGILAKGKTMVVGLDVTHPSPGSAKSAPSVAGIVASVDRSLGQWPGELHILPPRQEMVSGLQELVKTRLKAWELKQKVLPDNILVYRDGVSEGQYQQVLDVELQSFKNACQELYTAKQTKDGIPRMSIIVVGKRHNTRFYPTRVEDADRSSNPPNGTVVDRGITEARNWDFFLQAHTAIQGTARPAHYFIIVDEIFLAHPVEAPFANRADVLEDLTHNLCYLFGRATKAVSICPPAYYADLLCERARCYLSGVFDPDVTETASTSSQSTQALDMNTAIRLHPNVTDAMFYL